MSVIILSSVAKLIDMSPDLERIGIRNIHFYNAHDNDALTTPMIALVPFIDAVVLGRDAHLSPHLGRLIDEALSRHIPVVAESCLYQLEDMERTS